MGWDGYEKRRTRIVFPNGTAVWLWKAMASLILGWFSWVSLQIIELKVSGHERPVNCNAAMNPHESLERGK